VSALGLGRVVVRAPGAVRTEGAAWTVVVVRALLTGALAFRAGPARGQDFVTPQVSGLSATKGDLLDAGLPAARLALAGEVWGTRWLGLSELTTRGLALSGGWRGARAAVGLSQTGDPELGWSAVGAALGTASATAGAALRAVARRDQTPALATALGPGAGAELGAGAWLAPSPRLRIWASAPQAWLRGAAPPLARGLEIGGAWRAGSITAWLASEATPHAADAHRAGLALSRGPTRVWVEAREAPVRASVGLTVRARGVSVATAVDAHPVLGETVRLGLELGDPESW